MTSSTHSADFIAEMKAALETEREALLHKLGQHARREHGDMQATYPEYGRNQEENADEIADFIATNAVTEAEEAHLKAIEAALQRIEDGTYGVTADGETIPEARLRANPAATTTINPDK